MLGIGRNTIATMAVVTALSSGLTLGITQIAAPDVADATPATDRAMLRELKKISSTVASNGRAATTDAATTNRSLLAILQRIGDVDEVLTAICRNSAPSGNLSSCTQ